MKIFVMRHGEAEMFAATDKARHLTAKGIQQAQQQGHWLKKNINDLDRVIVSPYTRALETLTEIDHVFDHQLQAHTEVWDGITPYGSADLVRDYLHTLPTTQSVLLVSHLPLVGEIVENLCGHHNVRFSPATLVEIDWDSEIGKIIEISYME